MNIERITIKRDAEWVSQELFSVCHIIENNLSFPPDYDFSHLRKQLDLFGGWIEVRKELNHRGGPSLFFLDYVSEHYYQVHELIYNDSAT